MRDFYYPVGLVKMGALKTQVLENAITEKASTQVRNSAFRKDGKHMYGKCKYNANLQSDKKKFGTSQVSVVHFQVGWASGLQIVFF